MEFLADDLLEGRGTGTRGFQLAANYVRSQFEGMGLKPAGDAGSYFQNVHFRKSELLPEQCSLTISRDASEQKAGHGQGFRNGRRSFAYGYERRSSCGICRIWSDGSEI